MCVSFIQVHPTKDGILLATCGMALFKERCNLSAMCASFIQVHPVNDGILLYVWYGTPQRTNDTGVISQVCQIISYLWYVVIECTKSQ